MHIAPSWDYCPVGPYCVAAVSLIGDRNVPPQTRWSTTLAGAIRLFEQMRSPLPERSVILTDFNDIALISHNTGSRYIKNWIGVAAGFDALRDAGILDPLEVDLAEIEAHESWTRGEDAFR